MDPVELQRAKDLAARHLGRRMRSERELETYLERKGFERDIVARLISDFRRVGLLDDRALVREWTERRLANYPSGRRAVEHKLMARGVEREIITEVLDEVLSSEDERELSRRAAATYLRRVRDLSADVRDRRLYRFLVQRGFSRETITEYFDEMEA
jgi:regulatory protein